MNTGNFFVLIHSPLVGILTWKPVAEEMRRRGIRAIVPALEDAPASPDPFWKQQVDSVAGEMNDIPGDIPIVLVGHSGAGPLLPAIAGSALNPVHAYVFVDAGIPRDGATRLDLMRTEDPQWAAGFQEKLERGVRYPDWSLDDLQAAIPDLALRRQMAAELRPRGLDFFTEPIPVFEGWPDAPCVYVQFSAAYEKPARQARRLGWIVDNIDAGHFHMLVDPSTVTDRILEAVHKTDKA